jgi:hypothetical protein
MTVQENLFKLDYILSFEDNWNQYDAKPFAKSLINKAKELVLTLSIQPLINPTGRNSIQLEYEKPNKDYLEFELFIDNHIDMFLYLHDGHHETRTVPFNSVNQLVLNFMSEENQ